MTSGISAGLARDRAGGSVQAAGDGRHVSGAGSQFPDVQRDREGGDHDVAGRGDPLIHAPDARAGAVELADGGVQDLEADLDLVPEFAGGQGSGIMLDGPDDLAEARHAWSSLLSALSASVLTLNTATA